MLSDSHMTPYRKCSGTFWDIFVVYGEWVYLVIVSAWHLVLWTSLVYRQQFIIYFLTSVLILEKAVANRPKSKCILQEHWNWNDDENTCFINDPFRPPVRRSWSDPWLVHQQRALFSWRNGGASPGTSCQISSGHPWLDRLDPFTAANSLPLLIGLSTGT